MDLHAYDDCKLYTVNFLSMQDQVQTVSSTTPLITFDVSAIAGTKTVITDTASTTKSVTINSEYSNIVYSLSITPTPATANLITLDTGSQQITFAPSTNSLDANVYSIQIEASFTGSSTQIATSATATFTYEPSPCATAIIYWTAPPTLTTPVLENSRGLRAQQPYDSVSGSASQMLCGPWSYSYIMFQSPATYVHSTMQWDFGINENDFWFWVNPQLSPQGSYVMRHTFCLKNFPTQCVTQDSSVEITACQATITSVKVVQYSDNGNLSDQVYILSSTEHLYYHLATKQTPNCRYASIGWVVTAVAGAGTGTSYIEAVGLTDANGILDVGPITNINSVGTYKIQVNSVRVNGVTFTAAQLENPSYFWLTITSNSDCSTSVVTASAAPSAITVKVWDPVAYYPSPGPAFAEFTDSVSVAANNPTLCPKTYAAAISPNTITTFAFDTATKTFQVYSGEFIQIGTYTVTVTGTLTGRPTILATSTFTLTVADPCLSTTLIAPTALTVMTTSVLDASGPITQQVGAFKDTFSVAKGDTTGTQYCGTRQYTISSTLGTAQSALSPTDLSIDQTGLITLHTATFNTVGTHIVTVVGSLSVFPTITLSLDSFTVTITCVVTSLQVVQSSDQGDLANQTYTLSSTGTLSYALTTKQTPACGYPSSAWVVTAAGPDPTNFQTIDAMGTYTIRSTTSAAQAGTYTIQVKSVTVNNVLYGTTSATILAPSSFILTVVDPCATSTVTTTAVSAITLNVRDAAALYPASGAAFLDFGSSVSTCTITYTASVSTLTGGISLSVFIFDAVARKFQVQSQNLNQVGTFTATLKGEITGYPLKFGSTNFDITVNDPCSSTTLTQPVPLPTNMITSVLVQASDGSPYYQTQQVGILIDQVSVSHGDTTGTQYCTARVYTISNVIGTASTALSGTELSIDPNNGLISVYTASSATIGTHTVTVSVHLSSYPTIISTLPSFTVEIIGCVITAFTMIPLSPAYDLTYTISDPTQTWSLVGSSLTTQVPPCGYAQTLSFSNNPAFLIPTSGSTLSYTVESRDIGYAGVYTINVVSTLNGYYFNPVLATPTISFKLTAIDPCLATIISFFPSSVENFVAFAGYNMTSQFKYTFNDSVSISHTLSTDSSDFCGEKLLVFSLNNTIVDSTVIKGTNQDYIYFSPPADTKDFGLAQAQVLSRMKSYSTIESTPLSFTVTILGSVIPVIPDQVYTQGDTPLSISYGQFEVLPPNYNTGASSVAAYHATGETTIPTNIDLSCSCLEKIDSLDWIQFDSSLKTVTVSTSNAIYLGTHKIFLVQSFETFSGVNPYSMFTLTIKPSEEQFTPIQRQPPFFQPLLLNQTVVQCPNSTAKVWQLTLPEHFDPNNSPVTMQVSFDNSFFSFDNASMTFSQNKIVDQPVNQTIKVTLQNELNLKAVYSMLVWFVCPINPVIVFNNSIKDQLEKVAKQKQWPRAYIKLIEPNGLMHVKFNQKMNIPDHPQYIQNETVSLDGEVYPILKLVVVPGKLSDQHRLKFNWTFVQFNATEMLIQLDFKDRDYVSLHNNEKDSIQLTIYGFQMFADDLGNFMYPPTVLNQKQLPPMTSNQETAAAQSFADTTKTMVQSVMFVNTIVSILISGPLQQLLQSVKQLQIIVHIVLINLAYPPSSTIFYGMLMNVLTFQFYNFSDFYNRVFNFDPDSEGNNPFNNQFNMLGYSALYIVQNFGTLCWTIFIAPFCWAMAPVIVMICQGEYAHLKLKFNRMMFFNYWVGFLNETYLFLAVCAGLNLHYFKWHSYGDAINSLLSLFYGSLIIVFPFFVAIFYNLKKNYKLIKNRDVDFLARFGNVLVGLNLKRRERLVFIHTCVTLVRKLWLAYMVVFQQSKPLYSIFSVNFQALLMMATSGLTESMTNVTANRMDLVNESFVLITTYHLYQFTEYMTDVENRRYVGYSLIVTTVLNVLLNMIVIVISTLSSVLRKLKLLFLEFKQRRRIKQQWEKKLLRAERLEIREKMRLKSEQVARRAARAEKAERKKQRKSIQLSERRQQQTTNTVTEIEKREFENQLIFSEPPASKQQSNYPYKIKSSLKTNPKYQLPSKSEVSREQLLNASRTIEETKIEIDDIEELKFDSNHDLPETSTSLVNAKVRSRSVLDLLPKVKPEQKISVVQEPNFYDDLKDVMKKFSLTTTTSLYAKNSLIQQVRIEVLEVRHAGEFFRFSLMLDGVENRKWYLPKAKTNKATIDNIRIDALNAAYEAVNDIPWDIQQDIRIGIFETTLTEYARNRLKSKKHKWPFKDLGEYHPDMHLRQKMDLYAKLTRNKMYM